MITIFLIILALSLIIISIAGSWILLPVLIDVLIIVGIVKLVRRKKK